MNAKDINQNFDLLALVGGLTELKHSGAYWIGRCPLPGCTSQNDALNLKQAKDGWLWICRKCGDRKYHGPIDFYMRLYDIDFQTALAKMGGNSTHRSVSGKPSSQPAKSFKALPDISWQQKTLRLANKSCNTVLHEAAGKPGRDYLDARGITRSTAAEVKLGFGYFYDTKARKNRPGISIPWFDGEIEDNQITALKIRFVDNDTCGSRYSALKGSVPVLYGLWSVLPESDTLVLVEGELNAISILQLHLNRTAVVSVGSDTTAPNEILRILARNFKRILVWLDSPAKSVELQKNIPGSIAIQSPKSDGKKWDANQMLQEGLLEEFIEKVLCKRPRN